jgi:hypothetical protein
MWKEKERRNRWSWHIVKVLLTIANVWPRVEQEAEADDFASAFVNVWVTSESSSQKKVSAYPNPNLLRVTPVPLFRIRTSAI